MRLKSVILSTSLAAVALAGLVVIPAEALSESTSSNLQAIIDACQVQAAQQKLSGATKEAFIRKCIEGPNEVATGVKKGGGNDNTSR